MISYWDSPRGVPNLGDDQDGNYWPLKFTHADWLVKGMEALPPTVSVCWVGAGQCHRDGGRWADIVCSLWLLTHLNSHQETEHGVRENRHRQLQRWWEETTTNGYNSNHSNMQKSKVHTMHRSIQRVNKNYLGHKHSSSLCILLKPWSAKWKWPHLFRKKPLMHELAVLFGEIKEAVPAFATVNSSRPWNLVALENVVEG